MCRLDLKYLVGFFLRLETLLMMMVVMMMMVMMMMMMMMVMGCEDHDDCDDEKEDDIRFSVLGSNRSVESLWRCQVTSS